MGQRGFGKATADGGGPDAPPTARWLAFAAACLLVVALVSAGVIGFNDGSSSDAVVSAAGSARTVAVPSTVTVPPPSTVPPEAAPSSTIRTTTTLPRAASEVLRAIGTTAPATTRPAPTTTQAPVTSTTRPPTTTTSTTSPSQATVTIVNEYDRASLATVNGTPFDLMTPDPDGSKLVTVSATSDDLIEVRYGACTFERRADYFRPGGSYTVTIRSGTAPGCADDPAPLIQVTAP